MRFLRAVVRIILLFLWLFVTGTDAALSFLSFSKKKTIKRNCRICGVWARGILKILNVHLELSGELPPERGVLFVSNHLGYLDIVVHASVCGLRFAPKAEIRRWPVLGPYLALSCPVWVDRKNKIKSAATLKEFVKTVENDIPLIVYPEGSSTDGLHGLLPFKSTPFEAAAESGCKIVPFVTFYETAKGEMNPAWFGDQTLLPHLAVLLGTPKITAKVRILPAISGKGKSRKELAVEVREKMLAVYCQERGGIYE